MLRFFSFLLLFCALHASNAQAQQAHQVAVAALAGDSFLVNRYQTQTGTRISTDANKRTVDNKSSHSNRVFANYDYKGGSDKAWDALSSEEKLEALEKMAKQDIKEIVPPLLAVAGIGK